MAGIKKIALCLAIVAAISIISTPVNAGLLDTGTVYNGWKGTTTFEDPAHDLYGKVEWAVFGPGDFPFSGYTPTDNELAYVYQIFSTGSAPISSFSIDLDNEAADNPGTFSDSVNGVTGLAPALIDLLAPGSASWEFAGIENGGSSQGLVFSSPNTPLAFSGITLDHGGKAIIVPLPSPSSNPIPEPNVLVLLISALGFLATTFGVRRFSRS